MMVLEVKASKLLDIGIGDHMVKNQEGVGILPLKEGRTRLVIGTNGYWGKDDEILKARRKAHSPKHFNCYDVHKDTYVDEIGSMRYPGDPIKDGPVLLWKQ